MALGDFAVSAPRSCHSWAIQRVLAATVRLGSEGFTSRDSFELRRFADTMDLALAPISEELIDLRSDPFTKRLVDVTSELGGASYEWRDELCRLTAVLRRELDSAKVFSGIQRRPGLGRIGQDLSDAQGTLHKLMMLVD